MPDLDFVHLHVHSSYSLLEGALTIARLAELAKADKQPALALTDTDNMFGGLEFSEKLSAGGIQPIVGCALNIDFGDTDQSLRSGSGHAPRQRIVLLAAREAGYRSLMRLNSRAFLDMPAHEPPRLMLEWLQGETEGVIALTGGPGGPLDLAFEAGQGHLAGARLDALLAAFGDRLYVELQRHGTASEKRVEPHLIDLAYAKGVPLAATNEAFFATAQDYEAHDALICIAEGRVIAESDRRQLTPEHRFKSRAEMVDLFADLPEALASTVEIAERCSYRPRTRKPILPRFTVGEGGGDVDESAELRKRAEEGLARRLTTQGLSPGHHRGRIPRPPRIRARRHRAHEISRLLPHRGRLHPVGQGARHSRRARPRLGRRLPRRLFAHHHRSRSHPLRPAVRALPQSRARVDAGLRHRFLPGPPRRGDPLRAGALRPRSGGADHHLRHLAGARRASRCRPRAADALRPGRQAHQAGTANPANPISLAKAIDDEPKLLAEAENDPVVKRAFAIAKKLEGLNRHASTHAAGIVIGDRSLSELVPLYRDPRSDMPVTQFNMKWVEQAGLVKFDFLGLKTLTVLDVACKLVKRRGIDIDLAKIPLDDKPTYELLANAEAVGVFQLESAGMRRALLDMRPDRFEDIIALVALYRPGPMANIPTYCARKHGLETPDYIHPKLESVLKETFGVIVYQEQVMQAAQILAGYSLGEADLLRRAMGKKIRKEMQAQRERFVSGCTERGIDKAQADAIFDLLERFAEYGFNKSHAAAYALVAYQTAYMKTNYPVEFLAATMTLDMNNTDKLAEFRAEAERLGLKVDPPSINRSSVAFEVEGNTIIYALAALKGVGGQAVQTIVDARAEGGPFADLADFAARINPRAVNKRVLESLAASGAFDVFEANRARVFAGCDMVLRQAQHAHESAAVGQNELFGGGDKREPIKLPDAEPWLPAERLKREYDAVGFFLSGHPLDDYATVLKKMRVQSWAEFARAVKAGATAGKVAGTVVARQERRTRTGSKMGIIGLSDPSGAYEAVIFSEGLAEYRDLLEPGTAVLLFLSAEVQGDEVRARIQSAEPLDAAAANLHKGLRVFLRDDKPIEAVARRLEPAPRANNGDGEVSVVLLLREGTEVEVKLPGRFKVSPQIAGAIKAVPGVVQVEAL